MKVINLTPHDVNIVDSLGNIVKTFPKDGAVVRCSVNTVKVGSVDGIDVFQNTFGKVEGLPEEQEGVVFIVSFPVLSAMAGKRNDLVGPDTTPQSVVRDAEGKILGVQRFQTI